MDVPGIRTEDVLGQVAPAIVGAAFFVGVGGSELTGDVDRLTAQMNARLIRSRL